MKQLYLIVGILCLTALGIWALVTFTNTSSPESISLANPVTSADNVVGSLDNQAVLVEYADFQCPACAAYWPLLKKLEADFAGKLTVVYRYFPLRSIHQNADASAQAAQAAGMQNTFWEMADLLFTRQTEWEKENQPFQKFLGYAQELKLDTERFSRDFESSDTKNRINHDFEDAMRIGLSGTPTFFLNGRQITNPQSYDQFKQLIQEALAH